MQKLIKNLLKDNIILIAISVTFAIAYLSLIKFPSVQPKINNVDKVEHAIGYFILTFSWLLSFYKKTNLKTVIALSCVFYGIIIEVLQSKLTSYRTGDYLDVIANSVGVLLALLLFNLFFKKKHVNSH